MTETLSIRQISENARSDWALAAMCRYDETETSAWDMAHKATRRLWNALSPAEQDIYEEAVSVAGQAYTFAFGQDASVRESWSEAVIARLLRAERVPTA